MHWQQRGEPAEDAVVALVGMGDAVVGEHDVAGTGAEGGTRGGTVGGRGGW